MRKKNKNSNTTKTFDEKQDKIIIVMRHGERADLAGIQVMLNFSDPELTEIGKDQAYTAGKRVRDILEEAYGSDSFKSKKVAIISSPFSRTLSTAKYVKNGMNLNLPIYIENGLSEFISKGWFKSSPTDFLCFYNLFSESTESNKEEDNESNKIKKFEVNSAQLFINEFMGEILINCSQHILPEFPESTNKCTSRFHVTHDLILYNFGIRKEYDVIIMITHFLGIQILCEKMDIPMDYFDIEYCSTFIFTYRPSNGKFQFENNFYPVLHT